MEPRRVAYWQEPEMEMLLELLLQSGRSERLMRSSSLQTIDIFRRAARSLSIAGYSRTAEQCRSKFKGLKAAFFEALELHQGSPPRRAQPPFYMQLHELWDRAGRPSWLERRPARLQRPHLRGVAPQEAAEEEEPPQEVSGEGAAPPEVETEEPPAPSPPTTPTGDGAAVMAAPPVVTPDLVAAITRMEGTLRRTMRRLERRVTRLERDLRQHKASCRQDAREPDEP